MNAKTISGLLFIALLFSLVKLGDTSAHALAAPVSDLAIKTPVVIKWSEQHSFQQYQTNDKYGRTITFYLSEVLPENKTAPLMLVVGGSEPSSVFMKDETGNFCCSNKDDFLNPLKGRARLLLVEKPGVKLFDHGDDTSKWSEEFLNEHTLERITEAHSAALKAAQTLPGANSSRLLAIGLSEGAQVATHLAYTNPSVTHLARIGGNGPTQLFDMILAQQKNYAEEAQKTGAPNIDSSMATESMIKQWKDIVTNKDSTAKFYAGHPYKRWYSFCSVSPLEELLHCSTKLYIVHGVNDTSTPVTGFDVLQAELLAHNRSFTAERIEGADHSINVMRDGKLTSDLAAVVQRISDWFLNENGRADSSLTSWAQHYVAGRNLVMQMLAETGETFVPEGDPIEIPARIRESAATKMDQAVIEFKAALDSLPKEDNLLERKTMITLKQLAMAESRAHQPQPAAETWKMYSAKSPVESEEQQAELTFYSKADSNSSHICPICKKNDSVVVIGSGFSRYGSERHSKVFPTNDQERMQALLTKRHGGVGCLISEITPNMFCNRCDIAFLERN